MKNRFPRIWCMRCRAVRFAGDCPHPQHGVVVPTADGEIVIAIFSGVLGEPVRAPLDVENGESRRKGAQCRPNE